MPELIRGGCFCGAARYAADAAPLNSRVCHCTLCQRAVGAPFFARLLVPLDAVEIAGPLRWRPSSPEVERGFCAECGTPLFSRRAARNVIGLNLSSLDAPDAFPPRMHVWVAEKRSWLRLDDGLPAYPGPAPEG